MLTCEVDEPWGGAQELSPACCLLTAYVHARAGPLLSLSRGRVGGGFCCFGIWGQSCELAFLG